MLFTIDTLDILSDTIKPLLDFSISDSASTSTNKLQISIDFIDILVSILLILVGTAISRITTVISNHNRLFKLSEFLNVTFLSIYKRVLDFEKSCNKVIRDLKKTDCYDFIPPRIVGAENDIINSFSKEDLFEIFLRRKTQKTILEPKRKFFELINSLHLFDLSINSIVSQSAQVASEINDIIKIITQNHLLLVQFIYNSTNINSFYKKVHDINKDFIKENNNSYDIKDFKLYEDKLLSPLFDLVNTIEIPQRTEDIIILYKILSTLKQLLKSLSIKKQSFIKELRKSISALKDSKESFKTSIIAFQNENFRNFFIVGFYKGKKDNTIFELLKSKKSITK